MEKLLLIDGNSLINRAFYANPPMMTKNGIPTGAVFGFLNMFFKALNDIKPTHVAVAFDVKAPTFRHKLYNEYKGTRKPMPDDLRPQIPLLKEVLSLMNVCIYEQAGIEADDIIGTIAKSTTMSTVIITGDKDSFQLVDNETEVYFTRRGITDIDIYNATNFKEKTGYIPSQVIEMKALMGDSSDNIPGVAGVGEKTALNLITEYGYVDKIYENIEKIKGKLQDKLLENKELCYLSKQLATINVNCDLPFALGSMAFSLPFSSLVKQKFAELEFKSLLKKESLFDNEVLKIEKETKTVFINDLEELKNILKSETLYFVIDKDVHLAIDDTVEYVVKIKENFFDEGALYEDVINIFKEYFSNSKNHIVVYDIKKLMHSLSEFNVSFDARFDDVIVMKYIADFTGRDESLIDVINEYDFDKNTLAVSLCKLFSILSKKIQDENMESLYQNVELPLTKVLYSMEKDGFKLDRDILDSLSEKYSNEICQVEDKIFSLAGEKFNVNSTLQLGSILFEKLGIKHLKKNKRGYSTSAEVLEELSNEHEIIPLILKYRQLQKIYSTYIEGFKPLIDKKTGLIHTSFNQFVTTTGRLSSKEPNLQNIPVRDETSKEIRRFFVPRDENHILVGADYSQIELRLLAHFSGCKSLIDAYINGDDIHTETASRVFGVKKVEVTSQMRRNAKAVNFGIIYGISEFGLSKNLKISNFKAREYIKTYFEKYPEVKEYMDTNVTFAKKNGYVSTLLGRKRYIREINSSNFNVRSFGERAAMNMPLQGSSADIIKLAMVNVYNKLKSKNLKSKLILQVHDELLIDCLKEEQEEVIKLLTYEMENVVKLSVPLTVETEVGVTWYDAK